MEKASSLGLNIIVREEISDKNKIFIVSNEELGIADAGDNLEEAIKNFKKSVNLYLETYPEKKRLLIKDKQPILVSRIFL